MAGARITFEFHDAQFRRALDRLALTPVRRTGLLRVIGGGLRATTEGRFGTQTTPAGSHWQALNPAYAATKPAGRNILSGPTGALKGSLSFKVAGNTVIVGSNMPYAAIHQFGGTIRPKKARALVFRLGGRTVRAASVRIPPRPYLGFGREDEFVVLDALDVLLPGGR